MGAPSLRRLWVPVLALAAAATAPAAGHQEVEAPHDGFREAGVEEDDHAEGSHDAQAEEHAGHQQSHSADDAHGGGQHDPHAPDGTHSGAHAAAHGHGSHEGHHGGHHHIVRSVMGTTTAVMLLGFVAFIMALFYLVNWHDPDIRQYTWVISSVTVSIFLGVLSFQGVAQAIDFFFPDNITTEIMQFLLLWVATQSILFVVRDVDHTDSSAAEKHGYGHMKQPEAGQDFSHASREEDAQTEPLKEGHPACSPLDSDEEGGQQPETLKGHHPAAHSPADSDEEGGRLPNVPLKAYGMILAHITGFAGIKCFGSMQLHFHCFSSSWQCTMLVIPIFCAVVYTLIMASQWVRKKLITSFGDQVEDESEELWREQCSETEDDIIGLVLSSLVSVVIRYAITGTLPSAHGTTEGRQALEVIKLFGTGVGCLALVILVTFQRNKLLKKIEQEKSQVHKHQFFSAEHFINTLQIFLGLTMSWCFYFGTQWGFYVFLKHKQSMKGVTGKLLEALLVSFGSMLAIFALDSVGDGSPSMKKALKGLITALGLLVGISWEGAFALGVDEIAANWETPHSVLVAKTLLAFGLVVIVMPAWRLYIMPKSDPAIMSYYQGKLPPLMALCRKWDPATDRHLSKTERFRQKAKANGVLKGLETVRAAARLSLTSPKSQGKEVLG